MNFRSFADLNKCVVTNLHKVPRDIDLIVGIPRSGLLVANLLALHLNLPLAEFEGFLAGRILSAGRTRQHEGMRLSIAECRKVLVIDDSVRSGETLARVRKRIEAAQVTQEVLYGAVYVTLGSINLVDLYFEVCPLPRIFEWNVMHHRDLKFACLDIDGVLCRDPRPEENDDGERYLKFLEGADPLFVPTRPIGFLITSRLEKYRSQTERWLERHGITYQQLIMMDLPTKEARIASASHAAFKASKYRETGASFFIESDYTQAQEIAAQTGKPVLCMENQELILPSRFVVVKIAARRRAKQLYYQVRSLAGRALRQLIPR